VWGLQLLGIEDVYCGAISLGHGFVDAAHGTLAVPVPATLRPLQGLVVRPGPENGGELTTPTGAALAGVLSCGPIPAEYRVTRAGYGAGTKNPVGRSNTLRIVLAELDGPRGIEALDLLTADIDDMPGEYLASAAETLREAGALDVTLLQTVMKKGRPGVRLEVLCRPDDTARLEDLMLRESSTIGVRRSRVARRALPRQSRDIEVFGQAVTVKTVTLPGGGERAKAEYYDVRRVARTSGRTTAEVLEAIAKRM
jgi:uncharacterized protein (DUF111 family)